LKHNLLRLVALGCKENSFSGCKSQITTLSTFKKQSGSLQFPANERPTPKVRLSMKAVALGKVSSFIGLSHLLLLK